MPKMSRPIMELSERELKTLIAAAVANGILEAQGETDRATEPNERERTRLAVFEVDRAAERVVKFIRENNDSPRVVEEADLDALCEIEIRKLSPDALKYLAGERFVNRVAEMLKD